MEKAVLEGFSRLVLMLHAECRRQPMNRYQDWALEQIGRILPFDSALWMTGALTSDGEDAVFHTHHLYRQPAQLLADWSRTRDRTVFSRRVFAHPGNTLACETARELGPELAAHARRYGIEHILATANVDPLTSLSELISIYRADAGSPFGEAERLFMQALVPHLTETYRINRLYQLTHLQSASPSLAAATADNQGMLQIADPAFTELLTEEWPDWRGARLPSDLLERIAAEGGRYAGSRIILYHSPLHNVTLLRGRRKSRIDNLSDRENEIAIHFASGRTHKEIARQIGLSPATVRNHLTAAYVKLNVGSKAELIHLLREHG